MGLWLLLGSYIAHAASLTAVLAVPDGTAPAVLDATITVSTSCTSAIAYQVCCTPPCAPYGETQPGEAAEGTFLPAESPYTVSEACDFPLVGSYAPRLRLQCGNSLPYEDSDAVEVTAP